MKKATVRTMFVGASIAFILTLIMTFLVLEITPILSILVLSLSFSLIGLTIGFTLTESDTPGYEDDYHRIKRTLVIATGAFALLALWVGVWAGLVVPMTNHHNGNKKQGLWSSFGVAISIWAIGTSSTMVAYYTNPAFREYVDGPGDVTSRDVDEHRAATIRTEQ